MINDSVNAFKECEVVCVNEKVKIINRYEVALNNKYKLIFSMIDVCSIVISILLIIIP